MQKDPAVRPSDEFPAMARYRRVVKVGSNHLDSKKTARSHPDFMVMDRIQFLP